MYGLSTKKVAIVERRLFWRGGHIDLSGDSTVHSQQTANSYVKSPTNKYKYIANSCLCIAMQSTHVTSVTNLASTIYNTTRGLTTRVPTPRGSYNQGFLHPGVLQPGVLTTKVPTTWVSYNQGFLQPGVLTTRGSYHQGFLQLGVLTTRGSYNQQFL